MTIKQLKEIIKNLPDDNLVKAKHYTGAIMDADVKLMKKFKENEKDYILIEV